MRIGQENKSANQHRGPDESRNHGSLGRTADAPGLISYLDSLRITGTASPMFILGSKAVRQGINQEATACENGEGL